MPLRILIAEDSETNRLLFSTTLRRLGHTVDLAENGEKAVEYFRTARYDLVFLDLNMPVMNGVETARKINDRNPRRVPVYAISGFASAEMEDAFPAAGIRRCILKPLDREKFAGVLAECSFEEATPEMTLPQGFSGRLAETYAHELWSRTQSCQRLLDGGNIPVLSREAHTIAGLAQMLKSGELETAAHALFDSCKTGDKKKIAVRVNAVRLASDVAVKKLKEAVSHASAPVSGESLMG